MADKKNRDDEKKAGAGRRLSRLRFKKKDMPGGLWLKCPSCDATIFRKELEAKGHMCPACSFHFTVPGLERVQMVVDPGSWREVFSSISGISQALCKKAVLGQA